MSRTTNRFSTEMREQAVRLVLGCEGEHGTTSRDGANRCRNYAIAAACTLTLSYCQSRML